MKTNLLIFGTKNFNNSIDEIKDYLDFSLIYFDLDHFSEDLVTSSSAIIVDYQICENKNILNIINKIFNKPILILGIQNLSIKFKCKCDVSCHLPISILELKNKITNLIISYKFNKNSSIVIKDFSLDKNEKKLKKNNVFITITEREVELIELLFNEQKPLSKNIILKKIWKYAEDADTHTVETHIYRLRKKILNVFKDDNFIVNTKSGYSI
ncbi:winged helix-turn-helix domain-containing protein [Pelagibacteraceae bacterium]|nr:winged helix-turn-helix domain-containing protein [Pelagibacteraceae bacterium]